MSKKIELIINVEGRVKNTKLPTTKPLWPLFEAISNSLHSLEDRWGLNHKKKIIEVRIIRNGKPEFLKNNENIDNYPIKGFEIIDNGDGFNQKNFDSFLTSDSDLKLSRGAKGIGRFVCLKAFKEVRIDSIHGSQNNLMHRCFNFKPQGGGIFDHDNISHSGKNTGTKVSIFDMKPEYQKNCPTSIYSIAEGIIEHFLVNFILNSAPNLTLVDQNGTSIAVHEMFLEHNKSNIRTETFTISKSDFKLHLVKIHGGSKSKHEIHFCANDRDVKNDVLSKYIKDLGKKIIDENNEEFVYHAYVTGDYLDTHVDSERTNFNFASGEDGDDDLYSITLRNIREKSIITIENLLKDYLKVEREKKISKIRDYIANQAPQFASILKYKKEDLKEISPETKGEKLGIELYKIQSRWEVEVKNRSEEFLSPKDDITDLAEYKQNYEDYLEQLNEVGKSALVKYIVHRKSVINLLETFLGSDEDDKFVKEDIIHNLFFPIRSYSDDISYDKQNLWLIDERLSYHSYLSSDKSFKQIGKIDSDSKDRTDILVFNDAFAFVNDEAPYNSVTIIEFKRPERNGYSDSDTKKNPIDQLTDYIKEIRNSKIKDRRNKTIIVQKERTPFYGYIVCDFNESLIEILNTRDYKKTPDGAGWFKYHDNFNAYIEVISYDKLLSDAKKRNRVLFEKLNLPQN